MPSAWVQHVKKFYEAKKKKDPSYKYSQAMKDAKSTYKKKGAAAKEEAPKKKPRGRKKKKALRKKKRVVV